MKTGPRGGTTTRMQTGQGASAKKNFWLPLEDAEALRDLAYRTRRTESELIRAGLRAVLAGEVELGSEDGDESEGAA